MSAASSISTSADNSSFNGFENIAFSSYIQLKKKTESLQKHSLFTLDWQFIIIISIIIIIIYAGIDSNQ
jgi:hypothetical protein